MENTIYTFTPRGNYTYKFKKILHIYINDTNFSSDICASIRFIMVNGQEMARVIYCKGPDYVIYKGKKYMGLDDIYKLQTIVEREKIKDMLDGI